MEPTSGKKRFTTKTPARFESTKEDTLPLYQNSPEINGQARRGSGLSGVGSAIITQSQPNLAI
jgi:hypothetical protein